jgi:hypothetical protein
MRAFGSLMRPVVGVAREPMSRPVKVESHEASP